MKDGRRFAEVVSRVSEYVFMTKCWGRNFIDGGRILMSQILIIKFHVAIIVFYDKRTCKVSKQSQ